MKIELTNIQINNLVPAIANARRNTDPMPGRINMRLDEAISKVRDDYRAFNENLPQLQKDHIAKDKRGNLKTERNDFSQEVYVFKSDEDEQQYLDITLEKHVYEIRGLTVPDLEQLNTSHDQLGSSTDHFKHLKLITQGHANQPEKDQSEAQSKTEKED